MFKKVLFRGTVFIGSFIATVKMLDKIEEKVDKKRKETKAKKQYSKPRMVVKKELTEEEVIETMNNTHRDII